VTRNQFLKLNEKKFGGLLQRLRKNISLPKRPEDFDGQYKSSVKSAVDDFVDDYEELMKTQAEGMAEVTTSSIPGEKFLMMAVPVLGASVIKAGNPIDKIPANIAETVMDRMLPSGWTLSERVWDLKNYSNDILQTINNGILNNLNPEMLAKQLDGFLLPGRETTTLTPYGRSLGFDSMRLARNEVVQSGRQASKDALTNTPWVTGLLFDASDGCEELCKPEQGIYTDESSLPDPHPQCNCPVIEQVMTSEEWGSALEDYKNGIDDYGISNWLGDEGALAGTEAGATAWEPSGATQWEPSGATEWQPTEVGVIGRVEELPPMNPGPFPDSIIDKTLGEQWDYLNAAYPKYSQLPGEYQGAVGGYHSDATYDLYQAYMRHGTEQGFMTASPEEMVHQIKLNQELCNSYKTPFEMDVKRGLKYVSDDSPFGKVIANLSESDIFTDKGFVSTMVQTSPRGFTTGGDLATSPQVIMSIICPKGTSGWWTGSLGTEPEFTLPAGTSLRIISNTLKKEQQGSYSFQTAWVRRIVAEVIKK